MFVWNHWAWSPRLKKKRALKVAPHKAAIKPAILMARLRADDILTIRYYCNYRRY